MQTHASSKINYAATFTLNNTQINNVAYDINSIISNSTFGGIISISYSYF